MNLFHQPTFGPEDVKAVAAGKGTWAQVIAIVTSQTCGEACWHAREDVCRCSCGGRNHGCLTHGDGKRPERTSKIGGHLYKLLAVGRRNDICAQASEINRQAGYRAVDKAHLVVDSHGVYEWTAEQVQQWRSEGKEVWFAQYKYTWASTEDGAPARLKSATASQRKWQELAGWKDAPDVYLLWQRVNMPERPTEPVVDKQTGEPLENQLPDRCY